VLKIGCFPALICFLWIFNVQKCAKILIYFCKAENQAGKGLRSMARRVRTFQRMFSAKRTALNKEVRRVRCPRRAQLMATMLVALVLFQTFSFLRPVRATNSPSLEPLPSNAISMSMVENVSVLKDAYANVSILITIPDSPLTEVYRKMLGAPPDSRVGEEMPIPDNVTEGGIFRPVMQQYYDSIEKQQASWYGFKMWVTDSSMVPRGYNDEFNVSLSALAAPQVVSFTTEGTDGLLDIAVGPKSENAVEIVTASFFDEVNFAQLMLKSLNESDDGQPTVYACLRTVNITLPAGATILNEGELAGLSWNVDFGGGTSVSACVATSGPSIILNERTVVSNQNVTQTPNVLWTELRDYKVFDIKCLFPDTTWISVACGLNEAGDFEKQIDCSWTHTYTMPYNDTFDVGGVSCKLNGSLTLKPTFSFSFYVGWGFGGFLDLVPQWFETWIAASARIDVDFNVNLTGQKTWDYKIFQLGPYTIYPFFFDVFGVPVELDLNLQVKGMLHVGFQGGAYFEFAGYAQAGFKAGVRYDNGWHQIWETNNDAKKTKLVLKARIGLNVKPSIHLILSLELYNTIGPFIDFSPYADATISIEGITTLQNSEYNITWDIKIGLEVSVGIIVEHNWLTDLLGIAGQITYPIGDILLAEWKGQCGSCSSDISITDASPNEVESGNGISVKGNITSDFAGDKEGNVTLYASSDSGQTWDDIATTTSDKNGSFSFWWVPQPSTTTIYVLKVGWDGNHKYASTESSEPYPSVTVDYLGSDNWTHIDDHTLCKDIVEYEPTGNDVNIVPTYHPSAPIERTDTFYIDDPYVYSWLNMSDINVSPGFGWPNGYYVHWTLWGEGQILEEDDFMNDHYWTIPQPSGSMTQPDDSFWDVRQNWICWAKFSIPPWMYDQGITLTISVIVHMGSSFSTWFNENFHIVKHPVWVTLSSHWPPNLIGSTATHVQYGETVLLVARAYDQPPVFEGPSTPFAFDQGWIRLEYSTDNMTWYWLAGNGDQDGNGGGSFDYNWTPPAPGDYLLRAGWDPKSESILYNGTGYSIEYVFPVYYGSYSPVEYVSIDKKTTMLITTIDPHIDEDHPSNAAVFAGTNVTIHASLVQIYSSQPLVDVAGENVTFQYTPNGTDWYYVGSAPMEENGQCSLNWTIPIEFSGTCFVRSIWYGDSIYANVTEVDPDFWVTIEFMHRIPTVVEVLSGAGAEIERFPGTSVVFQVRVHYLAVSTGGQESYFRSVGRVEFSVNGVYIGADEDSDGDGIYELQWCPQNWTVLGLQGWAAHFTGPLWYTDSLANSTLEVFRSQVDISAPPVIVVTPEIVSTTTITFTKYRGAQDTFNLSVVGLDPSWYTLSETQVTLNSEADQKNVTLTISIDRSPRIAEYTLTLLANSQADPMSTDSATCTLSIVPPELVKQPIGGLAVYVEPKTFKPSITVPVPEFVECSFNVTIVNNQNFDDTILVRINNDAIESRYKADLTWFNWTTTKVYIPATIFNHNITLGLVAEVPTKDFPLSPETTFTKMFQVIANSTVWEKGFATDTGTMTLTDTQYNQEASVTVIATDRNIDSFGKNATYKVNVQSTATEGENVRITITGDPCLTFSWTTQELTLRAGWSWLHYLNASFSGTYAGNFSFTVLDEAWSTSLTYEDASQIGLIETNSYTEYVQVTPQAVPPGASFTYSPSMPMVGDTVTFDASASKAADKAIVSYTWDFGDSNVTTTANPTIAHAYSIGGTYKVNLTVTDADGLTYSTQQTMEVYVQITFSQTGIGSDFSGAILNVDGTPYGATDLPKTFTWVGSTTHVFAYQSPLIVGSGAKQYDWTSTSGMTELQSGQIDLTTSGSITGNYLTHVHDVAVTNITVGRSWVFQGRPINISVTISNKGDFTENVTVTLYYNITLNQVVGTQQTRLLPGENETLLFVWNTQGVTYNCNCTLTAVATIPVDVNPADNTLTQGNIRVRIMGDITGDGKVDGRDITLAALAFGTTPGKPRWNPDLDINQDGRIDGRDLVLIALNFGKH